jgi:hypothetical protein
LSGIRRIPRAVAIPSGAAVAVHRRNADSRWGKLMTWLNYRRPFIGSMLLMVLIIGVITLPLIQLLTRLNKLLPAY